MFESPPIFTVKVPVTAKPEEEVKITLKDVSPC